MAAYNIAAPRSVLAEAVFRQMLAACERPLDVAVESASIGPAVEGQHDPRVAQAKILDAPGSPVRYTARRSGPGFQCTWRRAAWNQMTL